MVTSLADAAAGHDVHARMDRRAVADRHGVANGREWMDINVGAEDSRHADRRHAADADPLRRPPGAKVENDLGKGRVYVVNEDCRPVVGRERTRANDGRRLAAGKGASAIGAVGQRDFARHGVAQRSGPINHQIGRSNHLAVNQESQFAKRRHDEILSFDSSRSLLPRGMDRAETLSWQSRPQTTREFSGKAEVLAIANRCFPQL